MSWIQEVKKFTPLCPQEVQDKAIMLEWAECYKGNALLRENKVAHFTSSSIIINEEKTKTLMVYHNIYNAWSWPGGHMDGCENFLAVAEKEAEEETGIQNLSPLTNQIISLDILPVFGHFKNGVYISAHLHLSVAYAFIAQGNQPLKVAPKENKAVGWIFIEKLAEMCSEPEMVKVYTKILKRAECL